MAHKINRKIDEIIIHCTDTEFDREVTVQDLYKWHVVERGFDDIGYHFFIDLSGNIHNCRPVDIPGAHCKKHNLHSIGICYAGGRKFGKYADTRNSKQLLALYKFLVYLVNTFPIDTISGHNDYSNKACPCFDVKSEYSHLIFANYVTE